MEPGTTTIAPRGNNLIRLHSCTISETSHANILPATAIIHISFSDLSANMVTMKPLHWLLTAQPWLWFWMAIVVCSHTGITKAFSTVTFHISSSFVYFNLQMLSFAITISSQFVQLGLWTTLMFNFQELIKN